MQGVQTEQPGGWQYLQHRMTEEHGKKSTKLVGVQSRYMTTACLAYFQESC